jgi:hypothetical protein
MSTALRLRSLDVHRFVQEQVEIALRPGGFSFDLARGTWLRSRDGEIEHLVTLPTDIAGNDGPVVVTANLGVHCRPLAKRLALAHGARRAQNLATFTRNVGQLSAKRAWRDWIIRDSADAERVARRLAEKVVSVGLPWLAGFDSLATIAEGFRAFGREDHRQHALPLLDRMIRRNADDDEVDFDADAGMSGVRSPAVFSLRIGQDDAAWHCDE